MQYAIIIVLVILLTGYILLVYAGQRQYEARGTIKDGEGNLEDKILLQGNNRKALLAMALCYLAKIKWLILTESEWTERTFSEIKVLGDLLHDFKDDILGISIKDKSHGGLDSILRKANNLLEKV